MNRTPKIASVLAVLILLLGSTALAYRAGWLWENAEQRKVRELKEQMASAFKDRQSFAARPQAIGEMWKQASALPEQYQQQLRRSAGRMFMAQWEQQMDEYFALPPAQRTKALDKRIDEFENMRKQFEQRRQSGGGPAVAVRPPGSQGGNAAGGGSNANQQEQRRRFGGPRGLSGMLDRTSPGFRAKMEVYMRHMEKRRQERGLPNTGFPR